jgi:hypothetical protein
MIRCPSLNGFFMVLAGANNWLTDVCLGPYPTKEAAMAAIAGKVGGTCAVGI